MEKINEVLKDMELDQNIINIRSRLYKLKEEEFDFIAKIDEETIKYNNDIKAFSRELENLDQNKETWAINVKEYMNNKINELTNKINEIEEKRRNKDNEFDKLRKDLNREYGKYRVPYFIEIDMIRHRLRTQENDQ